MNKQHIMYPYCEIAYKTEDSIGWKLAILDGDKEYVKEKIKEYKWFDYIVFNAGQCVYKVKDNLDYFPRPDMVHLLSHWIYWQDLNRWFVKENEIIPYPLKDCEITDKIQFSYDFEGWNDVENFDDRESVHISVDVGFETNIQKTYAVVEISALYSEFEKFLVNLKTNHFGVCHIEEFTNYKLLAWEKDNKVRFMIQNYCDNSENEYVPIDFDVLVNKDIFYKYFEEFYNSLKFESQKMLQETIETVYNNLKKYKKTDDNYYTWEYLEFCNYSDLWVYVQSVKHLLIGNCIDKIFVSPEYSNAYGESSTKINRYDLEQDNENVCLDTGLPTILEIENHKLILYMYGGSRLQISLDKEFKVKDKEAVPYCDVSKLYSKNIIGKKITDIRIESISRADAEASVDWYHQNILGENMFKNLRIELENGYCLMNYITFDNSTICEIKD
ncbi:MAG: hypothetical protein LUH05_07765 [Candidatus Gastranaerophilales bacterium]|nr:hypothetical protein [Candidatus Gastranaerophilales bacterium]